MDGVRKSIGFQGLLTVEAQGRGGGLAMLWKESQPWRLTGFYGEPNRSQRKRTWDLLRNLSRDSNLPWCIIGDMNNIRSQTNKKGGAHYPQWLLDGFNDTLEDVGLKDIDLYGHPFTWERGRDTDSFLEIRLDRAMATTNWFDLFPYAKLYNLEGSPSDHSAISLGLVCRITGDKNTKYFHATCNKRQRINLISKLKNDSGQWVDWQDGLKALIQTFYTDLFTVAPVEYDQVIDCVPHSISQDQNLELNKEVSKEEVKVALFQIHPDKAPGPDGNVLKGLNDTSIVLIPKKKNPTVVGEEKEKSNSSRGAKADSSV
ncbi:uncharacterized protein LOC141661216 [Apium graveolens]|uniref:uncharacterized protein LOC141661216 n=1 Tax=Apium graveolens TaxID=4045 RepID=UPI003D7B9C0C